MSSVHMSALSHPPLQVEGKSEEANRLSLGQSSHYPLTSTSRNTTQHSCVVARGKDDKGEAFRTRSVDKEESTSHHSPNTHRTQTQGWAPASADEHTWDLLISGTASGLTHLTGALDTAKRPAAQSGEFQLLSGSWAALWFFFFSCLSSQLVVIPFNKCSTQYPGRKHDINH